MHDIEMAPMIQRRYVARIAYTFSIKVTPEWPPNPLKRGHYYSSMFMTYIMYMYMLAAVGVGKTHICLAGVSEMVGPANSAAKGLTPADYAGTYGV